MPSSQKTAAVTFQEAQVQRVQFVNWQGNAKAAWFTGCRAIYRVMKQFSESKWDPLGGSHVIVVAVGAKSLGRLHTEV